MPYSFFQGHEQNPLTLPWYGQALMFAVFVVIIVGMARLALYRAFTGSLPPSPPTPKPETAPASPLAEAGRAPDLGLVLGGGGYVAPPPSPDDVDESHVLQLSPDEVGPPPLPAGFRLPDE
jgi:hypothetical protein